MKKYTTEIAIAIFYMTIILCPIGILYTVAHGGGWYCEYCHEGSIRGKFEVEQMYGNKPCKYSEDSCHHFKRYLKQPVEKPKYVK